MSVNRHFISIAYLSSVFGLCIPVAVVRGQGLAVLPADSEVTWNYRGPRDTPGATTALYSETTDSGFFAAQTRNHTTGFSDDLPGAQSIFSDFSNPGGNGLPMSINSFSFQYTLHASITQLPVTATVRFIGIGFQVNFITAEYGKFVIPDLVTGTVIQSLTLDEKIVVPANVWMEVAFSPVPDLAATTRAEDVGWGIAADIHSEGAPAMGNSDDFFLFTNGNPVGGIAGAPFTQFNYTPILPSTDPNYTLPGNFLFTLNGKKIPEPMTLGLLLMALTGLTTLRGRR